MNSEEPTTNEGSYSVIVLDERSRVRQGRTDRPVKVSIKVNGGTVTSLPDSYYANDRVDLMLTFADGISAVYRTTFVFDAAALVVHTTGQPFWVSLPNVPEALRADLQAMEQKFGGPLAAGTKS
jgi:hypothetical protein